MPFKNFIVDSSESKTLGDCEVKSSKKNASHRCISAARRSSALLLTYLPHLVLPSTGNFSQSIFFSSAFARIYDIDVPVEWLHFDCKIRMSMCDGRDELVDIDTVLRNRSNRLGIGAHENRATKKNKKTVSLGIVQARLGRFMSTGS